MTYDKIVKRLQREQDKVYDVIPKKYHSLLSRAINIEYKLTMVEDGHYCELDDEATPREAKALEKENN